MNSAVAASIPIATLGANKDAHSSIQRTSTPEIVIALCGPMGTPLHEVAKAFKELLEGKDFGYNNVEIIKLSEFIRVECGLGKSPSKEALIDGGNKLRENYGHDILVRHAILKIWSDREGEKTKAASPTPDQSPEDEQGNAVIPTHVGKLCHIIDSIKHVDELQLLRQVYGDMLHVVGVYTPVDQRVERLSRDRKPANVQDLIDRDSGEEKKSGQHVRDTFPQSDFFLRADTGTQSQLEARVRRFVELMMGTKIITPTETERAMYEAYSAARNSACLSRQVGASIIDERGELLGVGWNDVPRAFGGLYGVKDARSSPDDDHRCWNKDGGKCFNDEEKDFIANKLLGKLSGVLKEGAHEEAFAIVRRDSQLRDLIEFSRAVHAEMHALLNAGKAFGARVQGAKLFVTTYPCHSCARHIVAAGIREVYFLEPYRKSLATKLHGDALTESETDENKVRLKPFDGVAPSRYLRLFSTPASGRKDSNGKLLLQAAHPVTSRSMEAVTTLEKVAFRGLHSAPKI